MLKLFNIYYFAMSIIENKPKEKRNKGIFKLGNSITNKVINITYNKI